MRVLFVSWGWPTQYFPMVPLAWGFRLAGHEVLVATQPSLVRTVAASGLPAVGVGSEIDSPGMMGRFLRKVAPPDKRPLEWPELRAFGPRNCWGSLAVADLMIDGVLAVGRAWAPDLIVFEPLSYAGPLAAAALGIPAVRHTWGIDYTYFQREFEPEALGPLCERLGIPDVETFGLATVDPCLPVLQVPLLDEVPVIPRRLPMRYVPYNGSRPTPRWLRAPVRRPRICVTWGTSSGKWDDRFVLTGRVVRALAGLDAEIVAAVSPRDLHLVDLPDTDNVRLAEYTPFNVLFPTCDLVISQGGLGTVMTALSAGVPHLILPAMADTVLNARQLAATGAGDFLFPVEAEQDDIREITERMLGTASYADAARELQAANAALPTPGVLVESVRDLLAG